MTVDFREMAPRTATPTMYLGARRQAAARYRAGAWAAGVPGTVRGLGLAHARFGKTPWAELVRPAARLAREGFPISAELAGSLNRQLDPPAAESQATRPARDDFGRLGDFPESIAAFGKPDHTPWKAGDGSSSATWPHSSTGSPTEGPDEFYTGRTAEADRRATWPTKGGFISLDDLEAYQAKLRPPVHTTFRGSDVYSIGPPSSGGIVLCQMLNILERFDLRKDGRESPTTLHRVTEAMRRGFFHAGRQARRPRLRRRSRSTS